MKTKDNQFEITTDDYQYLITQNGKPKLWINNELLALIKQLPDNTEAYESKSE